MDELKRGLDEFELLLGAYKYKLQEVERELGKELLNITTQVDSSCGYTAINGQQIAYLQGKKEILENVVAELETSIKLLSQE